MDMMKKYSDSHIAFRSVKRKLDIMMAQIKNNKKKVGNTKEYPSFKT
jgi:hypothetical protein